jgi:ribonuclease D
MPAENLPEQPERPEEAPGVGMLVNLLSAGLSRCCAQHKVAVGLVGTTSDLRELVRWHADGQPADQRPELTQGWRDQVCGQTLIDLLTGKLALRVADPGSEVPVALEPTAGANPKPDP